MTTASLLKKAELFSTTRNNVATTKQLYAVANHFARLHDSSAVWKLSKVFGAILMKFQAEHVETPITSGDVDRFLNLEKVPTKFSKAIVTKVTNNVKTIKAAQPVKAAKVAKVAKPTKASEMSVSEFQAKLESLSNRVVTVETTVDNISKKMATFEAKLDILMAWLETNPEAL